MAELFKSLNVKGKQEKSSNVILDFSDNTDFKHPDDHGVIGNLAGVTEIKRGTTILSLGHSLDQSNHSF